MLPQFPRSVWPPPQTPAAGPSPAPLLPLVPATPQPAAAVAAAAPAAALAPQSAVALARPLVAAPPAAAATTATAAAAPASPANVPASPSDAAARDALTTQLLRQMYGGARERAFVAAAAAAADTLLVPQRVAPSDIAASEASEASEAAPAAHAAILNRLHRVVEAQEALSGRRRRRRLRRLMQAAGGAPARGAPAAADLVQRVQGAANTPALTPAAQQQIFTHLLISALTNAQVPPLPALPPAAPRPLQPSVPLPPPVAIPKPPAPALPAPAAPAAPAPAPVATVTPVTPVTPAKGRAVVSVLDAANGVVSPVNDVTVPNDRGQPQGQLLQELMYLKNAALTVGIDIKRGGVVGEVSSDLMPPPFAGRNLINVWDCGRLMQQS